MRALDDGAEGFHQGALVSNLADALRVQHATPTARHTKPSHPRGYEPGVKYEAGEPTEVTLNLTEIPENELAWREQIKRVTSLTLPDDRKVELTQVRYWGDPGAPYVYCRFTIADRTLADGEAPDFASLVTLARKSRRKPPKERGNGRSVVVGYADPQTGKVASRGGTPELLERVQASLGLLEAYCDEMKADHAYLLDAGDAIEGFENASAQAFTNDLSLPRQVEVASDILFEFTDLLARKHSSVVVAGVGSNHCRWRAGKGALGLPGDDWGVHMLRQLAKAIGRNTAYDHVSVTWPGDHEETLSLDISGTIVGLAHGHQASKPEGIPLWWAKQVHGGQPIAHAELLVTGHFHSWRTEATGRDAHNGREKRWIQCPTLDNGSDWYRMTAGSDSDPGLLVFTIDEGTGMDNMRVLRPEQVAA